MLIILQHLLYNTSIDRLKVKGKWQITYINIMFQETTTPNNMDNGIQLAEVPR